MLTIQKKDMTMRMNGQKKGFTLIELLVVIAIIALLLAIVLPSLNAVKRRSKYVVCATNQRQIVQTARVYAMENKDLLPGNWFNNDPAQKVDPIPTRWWTIMVNKMLPYWANGLDVVLCPGNNDKDMYSIPDTPANLSGYWMSSYMYMPGLYVPEDSANKARWKDSNPKAAHLRFGRNRGDFLIVADLNVWYVGDDKYGGFVNHPKQATKFPIGAPLDDIIRAIEGGNRGHVDGSVSRADRNNMGKNEQPVSPSTLDGRAGRYDHMANGQRPYFF